MKFRQIQIQLSLLLLVFLSFKVYGVEEKTSAELISPTALSNTQLVVQDSRYSFMNSNPLGGGTPWTNSFEICSSKAIISLENQSQSTSMYTTDWSISLPYTAVFKDETGSVLFTKSSTLTISSDNTLSTTHKIGYDIYETNASATKDFVQIDISTGTAVLTGLTQMPDDIKLKGEIQIERYFKLGTAKPIVSVNDFTSTFGPGNAYGLSYSGTDNDLQINWTSVDGADYYDLEYLFVDIGGNSENDAFDYDFNRATRINTKGNAYKLPLAFPKGWILYRVRAVTQTCSGINQYGAWSDYANNSGTQVLRANDFLIPSGASQEQIIGWKGLETGLNWSYSTAFAEDARRTSTLTFLDGSLRPRQTIAEASTEESILVANPHFDYQGRPAIQMLPAPLNNQGPKYYGPLDYFAANEPFGRKHFDLNLGYPNAVTNSAIGDGASNYYSPDNPRASELQMQHVPDAEGFPYAQTRYLNDGTNRVKAVSGYGPDLAIGSGHETRYLYGSLESQQDLDRLFGNNAGHFERYTKEAVTDGNNVSKVVYKDQAGRVVASAIAGGSVPNMADVDYAPAAEVISANILSNVLTQNNSLLTTKKSIVLVSRTDQFEYGFPALSLPAPSDLDPCFTEFGARDIKFDLSIKLYDADHLSQSLGSSYPAGVNEIGITHMDDGQGGNLQLSAAMASGTYTMVKDLKVNDANALALKAEFKQFVKDNAVSCGLVDPVQPDPCDCNYLCENSVIRDYENSTAPNVWTIPGSGKYFPTRQAAIDDCVLGCDNPSQADVPMDECSVIRNLLLADVSPEGQYFDNISNKFSRSTDGSLSPNASPPYDKDLWLSNLYDQNGVLHSVSSLTFKDASGNTVSGITISNIRDQWEDSFAETLLPFHPEYCAYEEYCGEIDIWDLTPAVNTGLNSKDYPKTALVYKEWNPLNMAEFPISNPSTTPRTYQPHTPTTGTNLQLFNNNPEYDHYFLQLNPASGGPLVTLMDYLKDFLDFGNGTVHSIWYFLDDPDDIAGGNSGVTDPDIIGLYQQFHGDGTQTNGLFYDGSVDKFTFFMGVYSFYRNLIMYEQVQNNCTNMPFADGDAVPNLSAQTFGKDFSDFKIRFPQNEVYENYITGGMSAVQTAATTAYNNATANSTPDIYETSCVCANLDQFLLENQYTTPGNSFASITNTTTIAQIASDLSLKYGYTISSADVEAWQDECDGTTSNGIEKLITSNAFPLTFLCGQVDGTACICSQILNVINDVTGLAYATLGDVVVTTTLVADLQSELDNTNLTTADVNKWISYCQNSGNYSVKDWVDLVHNKEFSHKLLCYQGAIKECSCESFTNSPYIQAGALGAGENLSDLTTVERTYTLNALQAAGYSFVSSANIDEWINSCTGNSSTSLGELVIYHNFPNALLCLAEAIIDIEGLENEPCANIWAQNQAAFEIELENVAENMANLYMAKYYQYALDNVNETFTRNYTLNEFAYTLYYYDQGGILVATVPPNGVNILSLSQRNQAEAYREDPQNNSFIQDDHDYKTSYRYNSLNQLEWQKTPDGGETYFWYDHLGRLVLSQNEKQDANSQYSYLLYDDLGRISESGQIDKTAWTPTQSEIEALKEIVADNGLWTTFLSSGNRDEIIFTWYDSPLPISPAIPYAFDNLQNRVASSLYLEGPIAGAPYVMSSTKVTTLSTYTSEYHNATHYSYDVHGNVNRSITDIVDLHRNGSQFFETEYDYDLYTGNVNQVNYQSGKWDEYHHRYSYDAKNRLEKVETSKDGHIWVEDADYQYYEHGPLARTELGHEKVQGLDYAYNINGWVKGINSAQLSSAKDMGRDGDPNLNPNSAKDAFGFTLDYFDGDYKAVGSSSNFTLTNTSTYSQKMGSSLYNGNISHMTTALMDNQENLMDISAMAYEYDQLNRIKKSGSILADANQPDLANATFTNVYFTEYVFDLNGNFTGLKRKDEVGAAMDDLSYTYWDINGEKSNRLNYVTDADGFAGKNDLGETAQLQGNYEYDEIGNLIADASEGISNIEWMVNGKVKAIQFIGNKSDLEFKYNPSGGRLIKIVKTKTAGVVNGPESWEYHYYSSDASSNPMMIYKELITNNSSCFRSDLSIEDIPVYGSNRLGSDQKAGIVNSLHFTASVSGDQFTGVNIELYSGSCDNTSLLNGNTYDFSNGSRMFGDKRYELSNHLGNVISVISDRKQLIVNDPNEELKWYPIEAGLNDFEIEEGDVIIETYDPQMVGAALSTNHSYQMCVTVNFPLGAQITAEIITDKDPSTVQTITLTGGLNCFNYSGVNSVDFTISESHAGVPLGYHIENFSVERSRCFDCHFVADVLAAHDYYPYGMEMPGRIYSSENYRYGFNGMEGDDEVKGQGKSYTTEFRQYDPRIGQWLSLDPLMAKYPDQSPYMAFNGNPIYYADPTGLEGNPKTHKNEEGQVITPNGYGADFADDWYSVVEGNLVMTNGTDYQVWDQESGTYVVGRAPKEHNVTRQSYEDGQLFGKYAHFGQIEDLQVGDIINDHLNGSRCAGCYGHGNFFGLDYEGYTYLGDGNIIKTQEFTGLTSAEYASWFFPVGGSVKGVSRLVRWLGRVNGGRKIINFGKAVNWTSGASKAITQLGTYPSFVRIKDGVAKIKISFTRGGITRENIKLVEESLKANGAKSVEIYTGMTSRDKVWPKLNRLRKGNKELYGYKIERSIHPFHDFKLTKVLK